MAPFTAPLHDESTVVVKGVFTLEGPVSQPMSGDARACVWITVYPELSTEAQARSQRVGRLCHIVPGVFTPVLASTQRAFNLIDTRAVGVDRIQRSFEPLRRQVEDWRQAQITDERAKLMLYAVFVDGKLEAPRTLLPDVHRSYLQPEYEEFSPPTMRSLSNAFTSAFKEMDPIPQFKATAKLGSFQAPTPGIADQRRRKTQNNIRSSAQVQGNPIV